MERYCLPALALPPLVHDALTVVGSAPSLLIGFVVINFGLLLPGLFAWLEKRHGDSRNEHLSSTPWWRDSDQRRIRAVSVGRGG